MNLRDFDEENQLRRYEKASRRLDSRNPFTRLQAERDMQSIRSNLRAKQGCAVFLAMLAIGVIVLLLAPIIQKLMN